LGEKKGHHRWLCGERRTLFYGELWAGKITRGRGHWGHERQRKTQRKKKATRRNKKRGEELKKKGKNVACEEKKRKILGWKRVKCS